MQTISQMLPKYFSILVNGSKYGLEPVCYPRDLSLLHRWLNTEHVIPQWQLNKSLQELATFFEKMLADDHQRLYLITLNDHPIGYTEIYESYRDRLARYYSAETNDMGWHLLIGETDFVGQGHLRPIMTLFNLFIFENMNTTQKIVFEPEHRVEPFIKVVDELAYRAIKQLDFPEKTATLYVCQKEEFYDSIAYRRYLELN